MDFWFSEQHTKQNKKSELQAGAPFGRLQTFLFILYYQKIHLNAMLFCLFVTWKNMDPKYHGWE